MDEKGSNLLLGILGALFGGMVGVVLYVILYLISFTGLIGAALGSGMLCLLIFSVYRLLGGVMDKKGLIVCSLFSILLVFPAEVTALVLKSFHKLTDLVGRVLEYRLEDRDLFSSWKILSNASFLIELLDYEWNFWLEVLAAYLMFALVLFFYRRKWKRRGMDSPGGME